MVSSPNRFKSNVDKKGKEDPIDQIVIDEAHDEESSLIISPQMSVSWKRNNNEMKS